jgi:UDP:flavonoid glycosyltransferase YjiC (YdhE family)
MTQLPFVLTPADRGDAPLGWTPPAWWPELEERRTILVKGLPLLRPALRAFGGEEVLVVVTTGAKPPAELRLEPLPENVRVERFVPYARLMPKVDLLLTSGGYGAIRIALAHGVPVVAVATPEEPEVANFVQWSGVGIGLKARFPSEEQLRSAATQVLYQPAYRSRAERAAALVEEMALARTA